MVQRGINIRTRFRSVDAFLVRHISHLDVVFQRMVASVLAASWQFSPPPTIINPSTRKRMVPLDLKSTVNLPKTDFPMKANLPQNEPKLLERWEQEKLYERLRERRKGAPGYVLHDGPPYANGNIHMGTALNKILK